MSVQEASSGDKSAVEGGWSSSSHAVEVPLGPTSLRIRQWLREVRLLRRSLAGATFQDLPGLNGMDRRARTMQRKAQSLQQHTMVAVQAALVSLAGGLHGANHDAVDSSHDSLQELLREEAALCLGELGDAPIARNDTNDKGDDDGEAGDGNTDTNGSVKETGPATRRSDSIGKSERSNSRSQPPTIKTRALVMLCEALLDADPW
jgi:hypothetical protein